MLAKENYQLDHVKSSNLDGLGNKKTGENVKMGNCTLNTVHFTVEV